MRVCVGGVGGGGEEVFVDMSCVCVWAIVCIFHLRGRKKIFLVSKDKNRILSLEPFSEARR